MRMRRLPTLRRRAARREPRVRFYIFCEGRNTEPTYIQAIKRFYFGALISVEIYREAGVPYTQVQQAISKVKELGLGKRQRKVLSSFEISDQIWVMFDRDEHPRYLEAVNMCAVNNIHVAHSNPCFEVWLLLHFREYDKDEHRRKVQSLLKDICIEYDPSGAKTIDCEAVLHAVEMAEARAEAQLARREAEGTPNGSPSTTVFKLTRAIREASRHAL